MMNCSGAMRRSKLANRISTLTIAGVALIATAATVAVAAPEPLELLRQSILSRATVDFSGVRTVVVFSEGRKVLGVEQKIHYSAPGKMRIVFLSPASEQGKLCLTSGEDYWEYAPASGRAVHTLLPPPERVIATRLEELNDLARRMRLQYAGSESVAGRNAHVVKIYTSEGVPVKKTWVDRQNSVELKTQRFDSRSNVKSSVYFTSITFNPSFTPGLFEFEPPAGVQVVESQRPSERMTLEQAQKRAGFSAVLPDYLPPGYSFRRDQVAVIDVGGKPTLWLSFSNGVETFSLFQRRGSGRSQTIEHDRSVTWEDGAFCFTLMGALSESEADRVRASIKP